MSFSMFCFPLLSSQFTSGCTFGISLLPFYSGLENCVTDNVELISVPDVDDVCNFTVMIQDHLDTKTTAFVRYTVSFPRLTTDLSSLICFSLG